MGKEDDKACRGGEDAITEGERGSGDSDSVNRWVGGGVDDSKCCSVDSEEEAGKADEDRDDLSVANKSESVLNRVVFSMLPVEADVDGLEGITSNGSVDGSTKLLLFDALVCLSWATDDGEASKGLEISEKKVELSEESAEVLLLEIDRRVLSPPLVYVVEMYVPSVWETEVLFSASMLLTGWWLPEKSGVKG